LWAVFSVVVLYLAVLAAGVYEDGMNLFQFMAVFPDAMNKPFALRWTPWQSRRSPALLSVTPTGRAKCVSP